MNMEISSFCWLYIALFLAVIFGAWLSFSWRRRKQRQHAQRAYTCPSCSEKVRIKNEAVFVRCTHCGARVGLDELISREKH